MSRLRDSSPPRSRRACDDGSSLLLVLVTMTILSAMVTVGLQQALGTTRFVDRAADWKEALAAAESGVDDYLARLNRDDGYWQSGEDTLADCDNVALRGDPAVTGTASSCGWDASTPLGWRRVVGSPDAEFHYDVDVRDTAVDGTIKLRSTGRVKDRTRTIQVTLRRGGFGEFLYFTDYETTDPGNEAVYGIDNTTAQTRCTRHYWGSPPRDTGYCREINFVSGDKIRGPMHTNDTMLIQGSPQFFDTTTTSTPSCLPVNGVPRPASACYRNGGSARPTFVDGIGHREEIKLETSIGDLRKYVTPGLTPAPALGCLYTGPTRIVFLPTAGADPPMMRVWSKYSTSVNPGCGTVGSSGNDQLGSSGGQLVPVPEKKVIMVQNVPATQTTPASGPCPVGGIGDDLPIAGDHNSLLNENDCRFGTLYLEGTLKGRVTATAVNNIVITGDVVYHGGPGGTDALGLIAENSVKIYHPVRQSPPRTVCVERDWLGRCIRTAVVYDYTNLPYQGAVLTDVTLQAAVQTLQHSFAVQSYQHGAQLGTLKVFGTLAQKFRGPVGTSGGTGYLKDYTYDSRLKFAPPPYFLDPVQSGWGQKVFGEVSPLYGG